MLQYRDYFSVMTFSRNGLLLQMTTCGIQGRKVQFMYVDLLISWQLFHITTATASKRGYHSQRYLTDSVIYHYRYWLVSTYKVIANSHLILSTSIHQCYRHLHIYNNNLIILLPQIFGLILHLINFSSLTSLASELRAGLQHTSLPLKVVQPFLPLGITVFPSWPHFLDFVHRSFPMPPSRPSSTTSAIKSVLFQLVCFGPS